MMQELIISRTLTLVGGTDITARGRLQEICEACAVSLAARLRAGMTPEDIKEPFVTAASLYSAAVLMGLQQNMEEFRAGDLTVKHANASRRQKELYWQAEMLMEPYLRDNFLFAGV